MLLSIGHAVGCAARAPIDNGASASISLVSTHGRRADPPARQPARFDPPADAAQLLPPPPDAQVTALFGNSEVVQARFVKPESDLVRDEIVQPEPIDRPPGELRAPGIRAGKLAAPQADVDSSKTQLEFDDVIRSVYQTYPLLTAAYYARNIADGQQLSSRGAFDVKLKVASENGPTGFYRTYRQSIGLVRPTFGGGELFGGYRIGRGQFQPWYLERQTNDGGEFKAGLALPVVRNRDIDERRAAFWNAGLERQLVEPEIQAQLIEFVQEASYAYWNWVAAGENYHIAERVLELANDRETRIESQVNAGLIDPPELTDNRRLVAERSAKRADAERKLRQTAAKLSLFVRAANGEPVLLGNERLPGFPEAHPEAPEGLESDIAAALDNRPELSVLDLTRRQLDVDYRQARNEMLPDVDAVIWGSQDVGAPTSAKQDKSQFELEAGLFLDVPIERSKARGKLLSIQGKIAQLTQKRRIVENKIAVDVRSAHAALAAAHENVEQMREAVRLAEDLAARERRNYELGSSDLLKVTLREQYAAESAMKFVDAQLQYYEAQADLRAALALDRAP